MEPGIHVRHGAFPDTASLNGGDLRGSDIGTHRAVVEDARNLARSMAHNSPTGPGNRPQRRHGAMDQAGWTADVINLLLALPRDTWPG
jgi:hypothetical protein